MIDIVVPFHGDPDLLRQAVRGVLDQTDPRWSLTIVDDNAEPSSARSWVASLADPRVRYVVNEARLGVAGNFQRCLEFASAELMMITGCDDVLMPNYVRTIIAASERFPEAAAYQPRVTVIDSDGSPTLPLTDRVKRLLAPHTAIDGELEGERLAASLMKGNWLYFPAITWRRRALDGFSFRQDLATVLDLDLALTLIVRGERFALVSDEVFAYRRHEGSASSQAARATERFDEEASLFETYRGSFKSRGWPRAARSARLHLTSRLHAAVLVPRAIRERQWRSARRLVVHAFGHH